MQWGKYIIIDHMGLELAIVFDSIIAHADFLQSFHRDRIVSAGMFEVGAEPSKNDSRDISVCVFGNSTSLDLKCRKGEDERLIKKVLRKG